MDRENKEPLTREERRLWRKRINRESIMAYEVTIQRLINQVYGLEQQLASCHARIEGQSIQLQREQRGREKSRLAIASLKETVRHLREHLGLSEHEALKAARPEEAE